jgi:hypothetical protein
MSECLTLTDSDRLCTTLCPESDSLIQSLTESDTTSFIHFMSESGNPTLRSLGCFLERKGSALANVAATRVGDVCCEPIGKKSSNLPDLDNFQPPLQLGVQLTARNDANLPRFSRIIAAIYRFSGPVLGLGWLPTIPVVH